MIVRVSVVLKRTVGDSDWRFDNLSGRHLQSHCDNVPSVDGIYVSGYWTIRSITRDINTIHWRHIITMTLKMTTAQVVETSVTVTNSSFQNYTHPDDHTTRTTDTPGFKPFTILYSLLNNLWSTTQEGRIEPVSKSDTPYNSASPALIHSGVKLINI